MSCKSTWHLAIGILDLLLASMSMVLLTLPLSGPLGCIHIWHTIVKPKMGCDVCNDGNGTCFGVLAGLLQPHA